MAAKKKAAPKKPKKASKKLGVAQHVKPITGRPTIYDDSMISRMLEMGKQGLTIVEIAVGLDVGKSTLYRWAEESETFREAFTRTREYAEAFHAARFRDGCGMPSSVFNAAGYSKFMGICFKDWREPPKAVEVSGSEGGPMVITWLPPSLD